MIKPLRALGCAALAVALGPTAVAAQPQASPAASVAPTGELNADELLARAKAAVNADKKPENERETLEVKSYGITGTSTVLRRGTDARTDYLLGPFRISSGTAHGQRWRQNDNGETILQKDEPSQVERIVTQTVERVHEPFEAWELTTNFASGHVAHSFYDPKTYYLLRIDRTIAGHDSHTTYEDYRTDAHGWTRPWHTAGSDDRGNDYDYQIVKDDTSGDVTEEDVAIPKDRRVVVEFPAGVDTVRLPTRFYDDRIYVRVNIQGRGLDFLLDTGSSNITIDPSVAKQVGLVGIGRATETVAGTFGTTRAIIPLVQIGDLTMHDLVVRTSPVANEERSGVKVVGLLGFDFIDALGLRIDYENGTLDALRPGTMQLPASATPLDISLNTGAPVARATVGDSAGDDFVIDTGAGFPFVLFQRFLHNHPDAIEPDSVGGRPRQLYGVGGTIDYRPVASKRLSFGTWTFEDTTGIETLSPNAFGLDTQDGLIGGDILKLFTVYTDYSANKLYLAPNSRMPGAKTARGDRR